MATPKLKTTGGGPLEGLRPAGSAKLAPAGKVRLKSAATGKALAPRKAVSPKPAVKAATPAADTAEADAAAHAAAMAEYERQMEEYNRQMEEYNRQMAELQAAEAAEAATPEAEEALAEAPEEALIPDNMDEVFADAPEAEPEAAEEPEEEEEEYTEEEEENVPTMTEEEMLARDAYLTQLQAEASQVPFWKTVPFMVGVGVLVAMAGVSTWYVMEQNARTARIEAHRDYIKKLLRRAEAINRQGIETTADAKVKNVDVSCSLKDAKALLEVVVNPFVKSESGSALYGGNAEGVAQSACLLLGLAAAQDEAVNNLIYDTLGKKCAVIKPSLFRWLLQRVAISDSANVNDNLKKLADRVAKHKNFSKKNEQLAAIWECFSLRATKDDVPAIINLLKDDELDPLLAATLCNCIDNISIMMEDQAERAALGDQIFETIPEKMRSNPRIISTLAAACSTKALDFYKSELEDAAKWKGNYPQALGNWGSDDILDYVAEMEEKFKDNQLISLKIKNIYGAIMTQNRDRSDEDAQRLVKQFFGDAISQDTSELAVIIPKCDPDSADYIGDDAATLSELKARRRELEDIRKQKVQLLNALSSLREFKWVTNMLNTLKADKDAEISRQAEEALVRIKNNTVTDAQMREQHKKRNR